MLNKLKELRESREEGFTLIELLVVIVIIGVLAAIALPIFLNQQKAAIATSVKSDVRNTVGAVATLLIKAPTSPSITVGATDSVNATTKNIIVKPVAGDNTTIAIGTGVVTFTAGVVTIAAVGDWDSYKIAGSNTGIKGAYIFDSTTGKYTSQADTTNDF